MWKRIHVRQLMYPVLAAVVIIVAGYLTYQVSKYFQAKHVLQICNVENMRKVIEKIETTKLDMALVTKDMSYLRIDNNEIIQYIVQTKSCQILDIIRCMRKYVDGERRQICIEANLRALED